MSASPAAVDDSLLCEMLRRVTHHDWYQVERQTTPSGLAALGRSSLGFVNAGKQPVRDESGLLWGVMDGELYRNDQSSAGLSTDANQAKLLLQGFARGRREYLRNCDGKFAAALWDEERQQLTLVNDRFGMKPLYYAQAGGKLIFASEIKALLADADVAREPSTRGLAEFFTFGHMLGETTLLDSVRVLPPAAWLVYDAREDKLVVDRYWRLAEESSEKVSDVSNQVDRLCHALKQSVDRRTLQTAKLGMSLSGGLDGRSILAAIDPAQTPLKSVCMGMAGSLDHRSAAELAALANKDHYSHVLDAAFLGQFEEHLRYMVHLTDGQYLDQCIVLPTLPLYRQLDIQVLLRGHAGELLHMDKAYNFSVDHEALAIRDASALRRWLSRRLSAYMLDGVEGSLFIGSTPGEISALAGQSLEHALADSANVPSPLDRVSHLFIAHRVRRETAMSLAMFNSVVETRVPFLDHELVQSLLRLPAEMRIGDRLQS